MSHIEGDLPDQAPSPRAPMGELPGAAADVMVRAFVAASASLRANTLNRLLGSVGRLASAVVAGGIFLGVAWQMRSVSPDDAANVSATQFLDLAGYVEQRNPGAFDQAVQLLLRDPSVIAAIGVSVAAAAMHVLGRFRRSRYR